MESSLKEYDAQNEVFRNKLRSRELPESVSSAKSIITDRIAEVRTRIDSCSTQIGVQSAERESRTANEQRSRNNVAKLQAQMEQLAAQLAKLEHDRDFARKQVEEVAGRLNIGEATTDNMQACSKRIDSERIQLDSNRKAIEQKLGDVGREETSLLAKQKELRQQEVTLKASIRDRDQSLAAVSELCRKAGLPYPPDVTGCDGLASQLQERSRVV